MSDKTVPVYNPNDRFGVRDGGPYADQEELILAEKKRAAVEGREPNYDKLTPTAGVPALTEGQLANLNGTNVFETPKPIGVAAAVEDVSSSAETGDAKAAKAQLKDLAKDADPKPSDEVTKAAVVE